MTHSPFLEYRTAVVGWNPPEAMKDHLGTPIGLEADFFQPPPGDIGTVFSAYTSLNRRADAAALPVRLVSVLLGAAPGSAVVWFALAHVSKDLEFSIAAIGVILAAAGVALALRITRFGHTCSYVGAAGAVRYHLAGSRTGARREEGIRFATAAELRVAVLVTSNRSIHEDTLYRYEWTSPQGQSVYLIRGHYRPLKKSLRAGHPYTFAQAADTAWTRHALQFTSAELAKQGYLQFNLRPGQSLRLAPDYLELTDGAESKHIYKQDIQSASLTKGTFRFLTPDPQHQEQSLTFAFDYAKLANGRVFLKCLKDMMGVQL